MITILTSFVFGIKICTHSTKIPAMIDHRRENPMEHSIKTDPPAAAASLGADIDSVTLARLIEEVRNEDSNIARSYDRTHNRHNR